MPDPATPQPHDLASQWVCFQVGHQPYALPLLAVQEINRVSDMKPLPLGPAFMEGVLKLRGVSIPVIDLRKRFGTMILDQTENERILIVETHDEDRVVGLIVDEVDHVLSIDSAHIEPKSNASHIPAVDAVVTLETGPLHLLSQQMILSPQELESATHAAMDGSTAQAA